MLTKSPQLYILINSTKNIVKLTNAQKSMELSMHDLQFYIYNSNPSDSIRLKFIPSQSKLFRFIPISVSDVNNFEPIRKTFCISFDENGQKSIRLNSINSETSIRTNPKPSFQSRSIRINPISD